MSLEGLHHVTAITGDAPRNADFYVRVLGLRMIKKTVNFDRPDIYHLYYGDERGTPGAAMTFFEYPGAPPGRAGDGMVHTVCWRVPSADSLRYWAARLGEEAIAAEIVPEGPGGELLCFHDPEGLTIELHPEAVPDDPLRSEDPEVAPEHALLGFQGVRAYSSKPDESAELLIALGFEPFDPGAPGNGSAAWRCRGESRGATYHLDPPPDLAAGAGPGVGPMSAGGTVHHVAWSAADDPELLEFRQRVEQHGARPTPLIDRLYFHSIYFREPSGVLFEIATRDGGFDADEPLERLGEDLVLPPQHQHLRDDLMQRLTPLTNPRPRSSGR